MNCLARTRYGVGAYGIVSGEASVDEVEGPGLAVLVFGLEVVRREEGRRGGGADRDVRQERIFRRPVLQLIERFETRASISIQHASNALIFKKSAKYSSLML
jgi:hypothetical protein